MHPPISTPPTSRILPPHELNARRARKQVVTRLPALKTAPPPPVRPVAQAAWVPAWSTPPM